MEETKTLQEEYSPTDAKREKVRRVAVAMIDDFPEHPFKVKDDEEMEKLKDSISLYGVLTPVVARRCENGRYELISGHRRKYACKALGIEVMPAIVREMSREEAVIAMVDSNLQREHILPSEKAFAKAWLFEVEKNRFTCDRELESFYLVGDFGVACRGEWIPSERKSFLTTGDFCLVRTQETIGLAHLERQGFPFFAGSITVEKNFDWDGIGAVHFAFKKLGINCVEAELNGKPLAPVLWGPFEIDLTEAARRGENRLRLTLTNNLRNLLGPHHLGEEPEYTKPGSFQKERSFWNPEPVWDERYCFVETGLYGEEES